VSTHSRPSSPHHVVIADDHTLFAETLELALGQEGFATSRLRLPERHLTAAPLASDLVRSGADTLLLDLDLGTNGDGVALIEPATRAGIDVVVLTGSDERSEWARAHEAGARKVMSKSRPMSEVLDVLHRLVDGLPVTSQDELDDLQHEIELRRAGQEEVWSRFKRLTLREAEVLGQLMQGHSVRDIAGFGYVAETTVRTQVKSILAKLAVSSQLAAVGLAREVDWQPPFERPLSTAP
jgi:DNA-binding NarL/FixJ family response regulator